MSYVLETVEGAFSRLVGLPAEVLDCVETSLQRLVASPIELGRKAGFPFPPRGQMYPFHCDYADVRYYFVAFYYFAEDERTLRLYDMTVTTAK